MSDKKKLIENLEEVKNPHEVWVMWAINDLSVNIEKIADKVTSLSTSFDRHIHEEMDQYKEVRDNIKDLHEQQEKDSKILVDLADTKHAFYQHVESTKLDHIIVDRTRFIYRVVLWIAGAIGAIATFAQVLIPLTEKIMGK